MQRAPRRTCVGCRTTRAKPELRRFVVTPAGVTADPTQTLPGRGAYVCPDIRCVERLDRTNGQQLRRALPDADTQTTTAAIHEMLARLEAESTGRVSAAGGPAATRSPARRASPRRDTDRSTTT